MMSLKKQKIALEKNIEIDKQTLVQLSDSISTERYARELYHMKRKNEDIYLIEYIDSIN